MTWEHVLISEMGTNLENMNRVIDFGKYSRPPLGPLTFKDICENHLDYVRWARTVSPNGGVVVMAIPLLEYAALYEELQVSMANAGMVGR